MDPFIRRLVLRLTDPNAALSRNRHFYTLDNAEGRYALKLARRLRALAKDIVACRAQGGALRVTPQDGPKRRFRIELQFAAVRGRRTTVLEEAEVELLAQLPGVGEALT